MSECVVRMKVPSSCYVCPLRIACVLYKKWLANEEDMPCVYDEGCLIICALPENHGRLVDADAVESIIKKWFEVMHINPDILIDGVKSLPTIFPAERREE